MNWQSTTRLLAGMSQFIFIRLSALLVGVSFCPVVAFAMGSSYSAETAMVLGALLGSFAFDVGIPVVDLILEHWLGSHNARYDESPSHISQETPPDHRQRQPPWSP